MIKVLIAFLLFNVVVIRYAGAANVERVVWDKRPIPVMLAAGQERLIHFPSDIRYWVPETLRASMSVLAANGVLYIQTNQPFMKTRIRVQDIETHRVYLLDIVSKEQGQFSKDIIVTLPSEVVNLSDQDKPIATKVDWPIKLMRFAAQALYAPERLSPADTQIRRVALNTDPVRLLRGGDTESIPLVQWHGGGLYVTAVLVRNLTNRLIEIAPVKPLSGVFADGGRIIYLSDDVRGKWLYATAHHSVLYPSGNDADRTCLYVISRQPFKESL